MPMMPNCMMISGFLSASHLTTFTLPSHSVDNCPTIGSIILQGPHHTAVKSTSTGMDESITSLLKSPVLTYFSSAIISSGIGVERGQSPLSLDYNNLW